MEVVRGVIRVYRERWPYFLELTIDHIYLTGIAVFFILLIGLSLGILITKNKTLASVVMGINNFLYTIPSIALFGFLVAISGIGNKSAIIALVIYGILPIIKNTYVGIMEVDTEIIESAVGMGSTPMQLLFRVQLPLAMPVILTGIRTMVIMTIALAGVASFIGAGGLGAAIWRGITTYFPEMTIAGSLLVALLAIIADSLLGRVETRLYRRVLGKEVNGRRNA